MSQAAKESSHVAISEEMATWLRGVIEEHGENQAIRITGRSRNCMIRALARRPIYPGSHALLLLAQSRLAALGGRPQPPHAA